MIKNVCRLGLIVIVTAIGMQPLVQAAAAGSVQLGPRPFYLTDKMQDSELKSKLMSCSQNIREYQHHDFSIGHRGAALQFPEHTRESYVAAHRMGAGILECDVTFTSDSELVCRHAQCDLHTTTNILATPLADKCKVPFTPATVDDTGTVLTPAAAQCCASDLTLAEFKSLEGKMDAANRSATTVEEYLDGTSNTRTDLYATGGTLLSHQESIELFNSIGAKYTPELKSVPEGFGNTGLTQESYAHKMIQEYINAGIDPTLVWPQSFSIDDVRTWISDFPDFGQQAVFLDGRNVAELAANPPLLDEFEALKNEGVNIIAPPMPVLLALDADNKITPSIYAQNANAAGLDIISWTTERSGRINEDVVNGNSGFYYQTTLDGLHSDGDILTTIDVLARQVGIIGLFSDWPATTTFYANCLLSDDDGTDGGTDTFQVENLRGEVYSRTALELFWARIENSLTPIMGYDVYRNGVLTETRDATSFFDSGLEPATTYLYEVIPVSQSGERGESSTVSLTTR